MPNIAHSTILNILEAIHSHHCSRYERTSHQVATALIAAIDASSKDIGFSLSMPQACIWSIPHDKAKVKRHAEIKPATAVFTFILRI